MRDDKKMKGLLMEIYRRLYNHFGPQHWWPGETPFEVAIGAILTQAVSWRNVERAISNIKKEGLLDPGRLYKIPEERLAQLIRPAGYYTVKARKIKSFLGYLWSRYGGDMERLKEVPTATLRQELLSVWGIGPESADSILLYAAGHPVFVVDAYTIRIFTRLGIFREVAYEKVQGFFHSYLPLEKALFNEYHALLVALGKNICTARHPGCGDCPLESLCAFAKEAAGGTGANQSL